MTKLFCDHCAKELVDVFLRVGLLRTCVSEALSSDHRCGDYIEDLIYCSPHCVKNGLAEHLLVTSLTR